MSVVLPAPFGPRRHACSPLTIVKLAALSAVTPPRYILVTLTISMGGCPIICVCMILSFILIQLAHRVSLARSTTGISSTSCVSRLSIVVWLRLVTDNARTTANRIVQLHSMLSGHVRSERVCCMLAATNERGVGLIHAWTSPIHRTLTMATQRFVTCMVGRPSECRSYQLGVPPNTSRTAATTCSGWSSWI
jgi:hypothetical protein